ncbi:MAG: ABC transporter permease [Actinobacteria bacterium]|nr:ABC transporter permease [Actinomycetota bacterium]
MSTTPALFDEAEPLALAPPTGASGGLIRVALRLWRTRLGLALATVVLVIAIIGPAIAPNDPEAFVAAPYAPPGPGLPLGADAVGHDVVSQVLAGGRAILLEALLATIIGVAVGTIVGMATGLSSSRFSRFVARANDTALALPQIVLILLVLTRIGPSPVVLTLIVAAFHVPLTARVARAATLRVVEENFIAYAEAIGLSRPRMLFAEILPNITTPCSVELGVRFAISTVTLASLGYLGFGGTGVNWGRMIYVNQGGLTIQPWAVIAPAVVLGLFVIGVSLLTDGLATAARRREHGGQG